MALAVFVFLVGELRISAAELVIRDVAIDLLLVQVLHISFIGKACICGDGGAFLIDVFRNPQLLKTGFDRFQYGLQSVVLLAFAKGLGINDNLVFLSTVATPL
ncbi:hypothetical protein HORIV_31210 [Vreelandella olivaria]|uniref:Uncharacterized protein n=1 Tax=Vreelandella olivaria TaxID=390919 RepID=A0ABM7GJH3_9GAMM|nr:hypothetical protein HORIV_31210 [Halomonas olivaria]